LLSAYQARVVVIGRGALIADPAAESRHEIYGSLSHLGGELVYEQADVTDAVRVGEIIEQAECLWGGTLAGVFHLAGVLREQLITASSWNDLEYVLTPKVIGAWTLHELVKTRPQCIFVSFSSVNGFFGGATVGAYAAANSFLDSFAHYQRYQSGVHSYTLAWSIWDEVGMSRGYALKELSRARGYQTISRSQGLHSMLLALQQDEPNLLIGLEGSNPWMVPFIDCPPTTLHELTAYLVPEANGELPQEIYELSLNDRFCRSSHCRFVQVTEIPMTSAGLVDREKLTFWGCGRAPKEMHIDPRNDVERTVAQVWKEVLGKDRIGVNDNFFDLGGHSLRMAQVNAKLGILLGRQLSLVELFKYPTISSLAAYLNDQQPASRAQRGQTRATLRKQARRKSAGTAD